MINKRIFQPHPGMKYPYFALTTGTHQVHGTDRTT